MNQKKTKFKGGDDKIYRGFSMKGLIGKGNSCVYEVVNVEDDAHRECVKEIKFEDRWSELIFRKEIELLTKLKANPHPNIVEYKGHYILEESRNGNTMKKGYIQMEKCKVNLKEYLFYKKEKLEYPSEDDILGFISSMIDSFVHLQKLDMAHRDAKPSNILICSENPLIFKLCDVGAGTAVGMYDKTK
jgi:serine/threonine protein kinase